jgi:hypothetical protein
MPSGSVYFWYRNRRLCQTEIFSFISCFIQDALWRIWFRKSRNPFDAFYGTLKFVPLFTRAQSINQSNAHLHSYTQHATESNFPISHVPVAGFHLLTFACVVWRDAVLLGEWFPTFRRIVVPSSSAWRWRWRYYGPKHRPLTLRRAAVFLSHAAILLRCLPWQYSEKHRNYRFWSLMYSIVPPSSPLGPDISICFLLFLVHVQSVNWIWCSLFMSV